MNKKLQMLFLREKDTHRVRCERASGYEMLFSTSFCMCSISLSSSPCLPCGISPIHPCGEARNWSHYLHTCNVIAPRKVTRIRPFSDKRIIVLQRYIYQVAPLGFLGKCPFPLWVSYVPVLYSFHSPSYLNEVSNCPVLVILLLPCFFHRRFLVVHLRGKGSIMMDSPEGEGSEGTEIINKT